MPLVREPELPPSIPQPLDPELLAWAAGFFDGEGTSIAHAHSQTYQLDVSVPQMGRDEIPRVLLKFKYAMLGVGAIYRQSDGLCQWRAGGRVTAEMTLALMWPWLGQVKKEQARAAIAAVDRQYADGSVVRRRPRSVPELQAHPSPLTDGSRVAVAWAAGFMDAEGYFGIVGRRPRKDGTTGLVIRASASQHGLPGQPPEVLRRLQSTLGGRIERHGEVDDYKWVMTGGPSVRTVLERLRPWLGDVKETQAITALAKHEAARTRGDEMRCIRGHVYDSISVGPDGTLHRRCLACERLRDRAGRLARGGHARNVSRRPRDPTRVYRVS